MKRHRKSGFFLKLFIVLLILGGIITGAYFAIDKLVVPKYFSSYGIHNMNELVGMMKTLYSSPDEKSFITNAYTKIDETNAVKKLGEANFPKTSTGAIDYGAVADGEIAVKKGKYHFTDREIGAILNEMAESGVLASKLPNLKYLNDMSMNVMEFIVSPAVVSEGDKFAYSSNKADISCTFKIDTSLVRAQMAKEMDTPTFLLNMIIPKNMYIKVDYTIALDSSGKWVIEHEDMGINGRTAKQSEILINLLVGFVFPEEAEMTRSKLTEICGKVLIDGIELLGDLSFEYNIDSSGTNGVIITIK